MTEQEDEPDNEHSLEPGDNAQLERLLAIVRDVLGESVVGAYLHGSAVLGGLKPTSDLDVLVVVDRATTEEVRAALVSRLLDVSGRRARLGPARPVELTVVRASDVRPWRYAPTAEFQYGEWLRDDYERGLVPSPGPMPDLAPLVTMTLAGNRALIGPPPADLLAPVPAADLRAAIVEGIPGLMADLESDTRNVLLTLARIWSTLETGRIWPKNAAAQWAAARLDTDARDALLLARDQYLGGTYGDWSDQLGAARQAADSVVGRVEMSVSRAEP